MIHALTYMLLAAALYGDLRERRIPNILTFTGMGLGLMMQLAFHGWAGLASSLLGLALGFLLLFPLFALGKFGGGDVKLLAAIGALRGLHFVWRASVLGLVMGGVLALGFVIYHREFGYVAMGFAHGGYRTQRTYPYSPAIALGVLFADLGWLL
ncbi:MAG: prepilin peptidase [Peptococcaceae bacterium]|nr:prepilin peptidase [Peptococcaceae bacterium]